MTTVATDAPPLTRAAARRARERSFLSYLGTALSAAVLVLVLAVAVLTIALPALTGARAFTVLTSSMEPHLPPGTLLIVRPTPAQDVRVGDVLTYQIASGRPDVVTHRVVARAANSDGTVSFTTRGDANPVDDPRPVQEVQVVGTLWYAVPLVGWANTVINGELRAAVIPVVAGGLFVYALAQFALAIRARRRGRDAPTGLEPMAPMRRLSPRASIRRRDRRPSRPTA
ncbi:signal peptidase I [Microbacterium sp. NPDC091313]